MNRLHASTGFPDQNRSSSTARRRNALLWWSAAGTLTLLIGYVIALQLEHVGRVTPLFPRTVLWCFIPYALVARWLYEGSHLPPLEHGSFVWVVTTVPFALTPLGFALLQQPYSRGAVLLAYGLSTAWFIAGHWLLSRRRVLRLTYLDASVPASLRQLLHPQPLDTRELQLTPWPQPRPDDLLALTDGVVLDRQAHSDAHRNQLISELKLQHVPLYSVEAAAELLSGRRMPTAPGQEDLWGLTGHPTYDLAKRAIDFALALATSPLWIPLCLAAGLAVKLDSPGPMLFSQIRIGRNGQAFRIWKIRSMRHAPSDHAARFAQLQDARITKVGRFIRKTRLDELPQLWNVLRGDMSLIGPRPEQAQFVQDFAKRMPAYPYRHLVRPGLTGWAQVQQGYADSAEQTAIKLSYDLYYVAHYSMALDLLIAYKTICTVATGFGAR